MLINIFRDGNKERVRIEKNILEKCCQAKILHIGIDPTSVEGCVYVRCLTKEDAGKAFQALHGWWFDGRENKFKIKLIQLRSFLNTNLNVLNL